MSQFKKILAEVGEQMKDELKRLGVQGQMELANAIFNGSAFVPYGPGQWKKPEREGGPEQKQPQKEVEEKSRGMEM